MPARCRFAMTVQAGAFVHVINKADGTYQVVSIDEASETCWVRRWPLGHNGSPPFSVPLHQIREAELSPR